MVIAKATSPRYPREAPFHPDTRFPELPFGEVGAEPNAVYDAVRRALRLAGLDPERFGTASWNPLAGWVKPGHRVLLKPNLVKERHPRDPEGWSYVMTHGSVIRAVADYVVLALGGRGEIWIADAPQTDSSWAGIVEVLQLDRLAEFYRRRGVHVELVDLRREEWEERDGVIMARHARPGDPRGYVAFDLAEASEFHQHGRGGRYYGADYATDEVNVHHSGGRHEYLISGSAVLADVFINLPKLKTHKKTGITCSLKNLVGINGDKNWLPHHTEGDPRSGGDELPLLSFGRRIERSSVRLLRRAALGMPVVGPHLFHRVKQAGKLAFGDTESVVRSGNWFGNDTTWRMSLDLNKVLLYGEPDGTLRPAGAGGRKPYLSLVDGVLAGEGRGPMNPDPVEAGLVVFGDDPAAVDATCATIMGFDPARLPIVRHAFATRGWPLTDLRLEDVEVVGDGVPWSGPLRSLAPGSLLRFRPHFGWEGHVEARGA